MKPEIPTASASAFAHTKIELAAALGITRQALQYHFKTGGPRPAANGRHSIAAWRRHLEGVMRNPLPAPAARPEIRADYGDGVAGLSDRCGDNLPADLEAALQGASIKSTARQRDAAAVLLFMRQLHRADAMLASWGFPLASEPGEDGEYLPPAIKAASERCGVSP